MSDFGFSKSQELTRLGLEWLKSQYTQLVELYLVALKQTVKLPYQVNLHEQLSYLATLQVTGMLRRLEGNTFMAEELKNATFQVLQQGVRMQDLIGAVEELFSILKAKIGHQWAGQPEVAEFLVRKIEYIVHLIEATIAAAVIHEGVNIAQTSSL